MRYALADGLIHWNRSKAADFEKMKGEWGREGFVGWVNAKLQNDQEWRRRV